MAVGPAVERKEAIPVRIPARFGAYEATIVLLHGEGVVGVGEAPAIAGRSPAAAMRAAAECARVDLRARAAGLAVSSLLGGARRDRVECNALVAAGPPSEVAREVERAVDAGFRAFKLKAANGGGLLDLERLGAARWAAGPGPELRLDFNGRLTEEQAQAVLPALSAFAPVTFEQPLPADARIGSWSRLGVSPGRLAADESLADESLAAMLAREGFGLAIKLATVGGPAAAVELGARAVGRAWLSSSYETSIGIAAALHAACVLEKEPAACGLATLGLLENDLAQGLVLEHGHLRLRDGPGLGIELDRELIERYRADR